MATLSIKKLAVRGTAWTILGYGSSQAIRLASNLILTRLLVPEIFGVMALVNVFLIGLEMFSDVGIGPSIIQDKNGEDPSFLNTAWTIQVARGLILWLCACLGAIPFANFYNEPTLRWIIPISGLTALINGFRSTSFFTANRTLELGKLTIIEMIAQVISISVMIIWAYIDTSVWPLVIGGIVGSSVKTIATHLWLPGIRNRFYWNPDIAKGLVRFGRWIFISTVLGFILRYVDRIILGKFLTLSELGVYAIAAIFSGFIEQVYSRIKQKVLFPLYSKLKDLPRQQFRAKVQKVRISVMTAFLPPLCILVVFGSDIIHFLFDERYYNAGWMLQILAAGWIVPIATNIGPFYLAFGDSFLFMQNIAIRAFILVTSMALGGAIAGTTGLICGIAIADAIFYPYLIFMYRRFSLWIPKLDFIGILGSFSVVLIGLYLTGQIKFI